MKRKRTDKKSNLNLEFIKEIQPIGGISFKDETVIKTGDGYESCVHIMEYPTDMEKFWLAPLTNVKGSIATIDISNEDVDKVKKNINRSMKEQNHRYQTATDYSAATEAKSKFLDMQDLLEEINSTEEIMKNIDTRIFLSDRSWVGLDEKVKEVKKNLNTKTFLGCTNLNETQEEWFSMYEPYRIQQQNQYAVDGQTVTSVSIAGGNPFHFSSMEDPFGTFYGTTETGGNVLLDLFLKSETRKYYNFLVFGTMGSGKSTLLKKIFSERACRGDFVRAFDVSGEFTKLTKAYGGKILKPDGEEKNGALNPLEIMKATDGGDSADYKVHMAKLVSMYRFLVPEAEQTETTTYLKSLQEFYDFIELSPKEGRKITGLPATDYPIFSDFHEFLLAKKENIANGSYNDVELVVAQNEILILNKIDDEIINLINVYGSLFNRHTSLNNILDEQILTFDISMLKNMEPRIFDIQITSLLSLCWAHLVTNGMVMEKMRREGKIKFEDIVRTIILIDESHRWINVEKLQALDMVITYMREARKYYGSIGFASQSIRDYVPEGCDGIALNKLKTLFELTQYKFIMHQDSNVTPLLKTAFGNVLTDEQIEKVPKLKTGDTILSIVSTKNIEFNTFITKEEEFLFDGGA